LTDKTGKKERFILLDICGSEATPLGWEVEIGKMSSSRRRV